MPGLGDQIIGSITDTHTQWTLNFHYNDENYETYKGIGSKTLINVEPICRFFVKKKLSEWFTQTESIEKYFLIIGNEKGEYIKEAGASSIKIRIKKVEGRFVYPNNNYLRVLQTDFSSSTLIMTGIPYYEDYLVCFFPFEQFVELLSVETVCWSINISPLYYKNPLANCYNEIEKQNAFSILTTRRKEGAGNSLFYEDEEFLPFVPLLKNNTYYFVFGVWTFECSCEGTNHTKSGITYLNIPIYSYEYSTFGGALFFPNSFLFSQRCDTMFFNSDNGFAKAGLVFALTKNSEKDIYIEEIERGNTEFVWGSGSEMVTSYDGYCFYLEESYPHAFIYNKGVYIYGLLKQKEFTILLYKDANSPWVRFKMKTGNGHKGFVSFTMNITNNRLYYNCAIDSFDGKNIKMFNIVRDTCVRFFVKWRTRNFVDDCFPFNKVSKETDTITQNTYENTEGVQINNVDIETQWQLNTDWINPKQIERFKELFISEDVYLLDTLKNECIPVQVTTSEFVHKTLQNNSNKGFNVQIKVKRRNTQTT